LGEEASGGPLCEHDFLEKKSKWKATCEHDFGEEQVGGQDDRNRLMEGLPLYFIEKRLKSPFLELRIPYRLATGLP
jgi:hypothetical protein